MGSSEFQFDVYPKRQQALFSFHDRGSASRHSRSSSAPVYQPGSSDFLQSSEDKTSWSCFLKRIDGDGNRRISLERDVHELQMQLQLEKTVRRALERALNSPCEPLPVETCSLSSQTKDLITEIANLETEVVELEKHVLTLYRKVYDSKAQHVPAQKRVLSTDHKAPNRTRKSHRRHVSATHQGCNSLQQAVLCTPSRTRHASLLGGNFTIDEEPSSLDNAIVRVREFQASTPRLWPSAADAQKTKRATPPSKSRNTSAFLSTDCLYGSPNILSERMVRCMAAIYCKLADPPLPFFGSLLSPPSSTSTSSSNTSRDASSDGWSPQWKDSTDGHCSMIEVPWIRVDKERLTYAANALRNFRSMVEQLEHVHPGEMKHDEKLAFWINVHNALVMHAYLAYGIPRSHLKRVSLLQKAAYKVGSHSINVYAIEQTILGCKLQRPSQWLQTLFGSQTKFKTEDRRAYALNNPEPLVYFALCYGGHSDPAVRVYTPKTVNSELEVARNDYLATTVNNKNNRILIPKLVESYARDSGLPHNKLMELVCHNVSQKQKDIIRKCLPGKPRQHHHHLEWMPYDFSFRYIFVRELAR